MHNQMAKNKNRYIEGFSLIELVVVIAIVSVLSGMLVPMFIKFANDKRESACKTNREAILDVYAKCVYGNNLEVSDDGISALMAANLSSGVIPDDYVNEVNDFMECSSGGIYSADIISGTTIARIACSVHGEECVMDFTGWTGSRKEAMADPGYVEPTTPVLISPGASPSPSPNVTVTPPTSKNGVWPYQYDENGVIDERWAKAEGDAGKGCIPGNYVDIPLGDNGKAHFIAERTGAEYVIVHGYPDDKSNYYRVMAEWADGPDTIDEAGWEIVVKVNRKYDTVTNPPPHLTTVQKKYTWNPEKNANDITDEEVEDATHYMVSYGDIVTIHNGNQSATYIYNKLNYSFEDTVWITLPTEMNPVYGVGYNGWYKVPPLYTE